MCSFLYERDKYDIRYITVDGFTIIVIKYRLIIYRFVFEFEYFGLALDIIFEFGWVTTRLVQDHYPSPKNNSNNNNKKKPISFCTNIFRNIESSKYYTISKC